MTSKNEQSPNRTSRQMFGWLWNGYLRPHAGLLAVAAVLMMIEGATFGSLSYMMQPMFDNVFVGGQEGSIWVVGLIIFAIFVTRAVTALSQKVILTNVSEKSAAAMRTDLMDHLMDLDSSFHQTHPPGQLIEQVQGDVQALAKVWTTLVTGFARDLVAVIGLFCVAAFIDWRWMLIALIGIPVVVLPSYALQQPDQAQ